MAPPEVSRAELELLQAAHTNNGTVWIAAGEAAAASSLQAKGFGVFIDSEAFCVNSAGVALALSHPSARAA